VFYAGNGSAETVPVFLGTNGSSRDLKRGLSRSTSLSCSNRQVGSVASLSAHDNHMSQSVVEQVLTSDLGVAGIEHRRSTLVGRLSLLSFARNIEGLWAVRIAVADEYVA
jgi:hypothetical protein